MNKDLKELKVVTKEVENPYYGQSDDAWPLFKSVAVGTVITVYRSKIKYWDWCVIPWKVVKIVGETPSFTAKFATDLDANSEPCEPKTLQEWIARTEVEGHAPAAFAYSVLDRMWQNPELRQLVETSIEQEYDSYEGGTYEQEHDSFE